MTKKFDSDDEVITVSKLKLVKLFSAIEELNRNKFSEVDKTNEEIKKNSI